MTTINLSKMHQLPPCGLRELLARYGLAYHEVSAGAPIPGSYWGAPEAGIVGHRLYMRQDTPLHSVLHEAGHVICMDAARRAHLNTDAGGNYAEEDAVCYLQIVLAGVLGMPIERICADMDDWGYTFRLGSAMAWFKSDAEDARAWLIGYGLLTPSGAPTYRMRAA
jgi:hypothetical protein